METINDVGQLYFKNLRKQQKRRSAERKREDCDRKDNAEQSDAQCSGNKDLVKNCTVTTKVGKANKMKIDHITEPPAKKPRKLGDKNYEQAEAQCSGSKAWKALQLVGNCTATTVEQAEKIEKSRSTKAEGKRPQPPENERFFVEIDPKNIKPLGKIIGSELFE